MLALSVLAVLTKSAAAMAANRHYTAVAHDAARAGQFCGQVLETVEDLTEIEAMWKVPTGTIPADEHERPRSEQWVGIGGFEPGCAYRAYAGTMATLIGNETSYDLLCGTESYTLGITGEVKPGDDVHVKVVIEKPNVMTCYFENLTTGQKDHETVRTPDYFCRNSAQWLQQSEFLNEDEEVYYPFSTFQIHSAKAKDKKGKTYDLAGSKSLTWQPKDGKQLCHPSDLAADSVTINYDGPK